MAGLRQLRLVLLATLMALGSLTASAWGSTTLDFNPTGGGLGGTTNFGPLTIGSVDPIPGSALALNFNQPVAGGGFQLPAVGQTFDLLYQANVGNLLDVNGNAVFGYGTSGNTGQLTVVARLTEVLDSISAAVATFHSAGGGVINYYFNPTRAANALHGTDFAPGTPGNTLAAGTYIPVYTGTFRAGDGGNFSADLTKLTPLDNFAPNSYNGTGGSANLQSFQGQGGTNLSVQTTSLDGAFFTNAPPAGLLVQLLNTSNNLPFNQTDPSSQMWDGTIAAGAVNDGFNAGQASTLSNPQGVVPPTGPNVLFQADANASFTSVPEPGTISMAMTGIGLASLGGLRTYWRRRHRSKTATV